MYVISPTQCVLTCGGLNCLFNYESSLKKVRLELTRTVIRRSSFTDANRDRPVAIFQESFFYLLEKVRSSIPTKDTAEMVRLIDSTTIDLNLNQFQWVEFRSTKAGIKLHTVYDPEAEVPVYFEMTTAKVNDCKALTKLPMMPSMTYVVDFAYNDYGWYYALDQQGSTFVGRMKTSAAYEVTERRNVAGNVLADEVIRFTAKKAKKIVRLHYVESPFVE
jgi:putative transposase